MHHTGLSKTTQYIYIYVFKCGVGLGCRSGLQGLVGGEAVVGFSVGQFTVRVKQLFRCS